MFEMGTEGATGIVHGIRLKNSDEYRYVGITTKTLSRRSHQHLRNAALGRKTPLYDWMRKFQAEELAADVLEVLDGLDELGEAEIEWIACLRSQDERLLNISEGGLGPTGVVWTEEQREAARVRSTGRPGLSRPGELNPFHGKNHSVEQRKKWSRDRKGTNSGPENPNFGKFGPDHPSYGHVVGEQTRKLLSETRMGSKNPNFGKSPSAETRAKQSASTKGIPRPANKRNAHTRHHTNKNVVKSDCTYCIEDAAAQNPKKESEQFR